MKICFRKGQLENFSDAFLDFYEIGECIIVSEGMDASADSPHHHHHYHYLRLLQKRYGTTIRIQHDNRVSLRKYIKLN